MSRFLYSLPCLLALACAGKDAPSAVEPPAASDQAALPTPPSAAPTPAPAAVEPQAEQPAAAAAGPGTSADSDRAATPDALYGSWHEDHSAQHAEGQVMVPISVDLGPARFRSSLTFGRDGSFAIRRLHPADAHYTCGGSFTTRSKTQLSARCFDKLKQGEVRFDIQLVSVAPERVVLRVDELK